MRSNACPKDAAPKRPLDKLGKAKDNDNEEMRKREKKRIRSEGGGWGGLKAAAPPVWEGGSASRGGQGMHVRPRWLLQVRMKIHAIVRGGMKRNGRAA